MITLAAIGLPSTGKSSVLNAVFGTQFRVDAAGGTRANESCVLQWHGHEVTVVDARAGFEAVPEADAYALVCDKDLTQAEHEVLRRVRRTYGVVLNKADTFRAADRAKLIERLGRSASRVAVCAAAPVRVAERAGEVVYETAEPDVEAARIMMADMIGAAERSARVVARETTGAVLRRLQRWIGCVVVVAGLYGAEANYDEAKVPAYTLPKIDASSKAAWAKQRAEIVRMFETEMYGRVPGPPATMDIELVESGEALGGLAKRKQYVVRFGKNAEAPRMELLLYLPAKATGRVPVFFGLNFTGNMTVNADPAIRPTRQWLPDYARKMGRGAAANRWQIEEVVKRGYGTATAYYGDFDPDFDDGFANGVHGLYGKPKPGEWGAIGAWAWGIMRAVDVLERDPQVEPKQIIIHGHSRLGKAVLWAGALDSRPYVVISNDSGAGGSALSKRIYGETVRDLNDRFPHWFTANFRKYNDREQELPFDQHMLLALIAPRALYLSTAVDDRWADPKGEFLAAQAADPVFRLLAGDGLPAKEMPVVDQPVMGQIGFHMRTGGHDVTLYDWQRWIDFADLHRRGRAR